VVPRVEEETAWIRIAELIRFAGYSAVGLAVPTGLMRDKIAVLKAAFETAGLETALRVDLTAGSRIELLRLLRRFRNSYDVVAVKCVNQRVATVACRDRRVDIITFDPARKGVRFTHPLANLLRGAIEFSLVSSLFKETRREVFAGIAKQCSIAHEHRVKVVVSSGCSHAGQVRSPLQLAALASVMGLSEDQSYAGVSSVPLSIIERNLAHRSPEYVENGVRVVLPRMA
jgi:RNase P/RNase MRP subunit p30